MRGIMRLIKRDIRNGNFRDFIDYGSTYDVRVWVRDKENKYKIDKLIGESKPEAVEFVNFETAQLSYSGCAAGILLGDERFDTPKEALAHAKTVISNLKERKKDINLDTKKLGLNGWSIETAKKCDSPLTINSCTFLGPILINHISSHSPAAELIEEFYDYLISRKGEVPKHLSYLKEMANEWPIPESGDGMDKVENIVAFFYEIGLYGILLKVSTPIRTYSSRDDSYSYADSTCYTGWVYGDNFDLAIERALEFCAECHEYDKKNRESKTTLLRTSKPPECSPSNQSSTNKPCT